MNPYLDKLQPYPFEKLADLKSAVNPPTDKSPIALSIGEPKHEPPQFVLDVLKNNLNKIDRYPITKGDLELRQAIAAWLQQRFNLPEDSLQAEENVLPVNGTREALFSFTQAAIDSTSIDSKPLALMPNPFYQIYEGAAILAGADPYFLACEAKNDFIPDYDAIAGTTWDKCQILFICTPGNPSGAVTSIEQFKKLIALADKHQFIIASDECYSEIYSGDAPPGLLQACVEAGNITYKNCIVFHSLSKRSNLPGLRSGFVAGDKKIIKQYLSYRTYHGCAMSVPSQIASIAAWQDEAHVQKNRDLYHEKFNMAFDTLKDYYEIEIPQAGFYFWLKTPINDIDFAQQLFAQENITVLPGQFLSRVIDGVNPGENYVRMAMVAPLKECEQAAQRLKIFSTNIQK